MDRYQQTQNLLNEREAEIVSLNEERAKLEQQLSESQQHEVKWMKQANVYANEAEQFRYDRDQLAAKVKKLDENTDD